MSQRRKELFANAMGSLRASLSRSPQAVAALAMAAGLAAPQAQAFDLNIGSVIGGVAGAAVGSKLSQKHGTAAAIIMGIGGAYVGDKVQQGLEAEAKRKAEEEAMRRQAEPLPPAPAPGALGVPPAPQPGYGAAQPLPYQVPPPADAAKKWLSVQGPQSYLHLVGDSDRASARLVQIAAAVQQARSGSDRLREYERERA